MNTILSDLIRPALRIAAITGRPMRIPSPDQYAEAIPMVNRMLASWSVDRLKIYTESIDRYPLQSPGNPGQTTYFIGPTGDFVAPRPISIHRANIVLTATSPEQHEHVHIMSDDEWAAKTITELPGGPWPYQLYNDGAVPDSKLYLFPFPTFPCDLELFTWLQLPEFAAVTDTVILPPGYEEAIVYNLAKRISAHYPLESKITPEALELARSSLADIESLNAPSPVMKVDGAIRAAGETRGTRWNYLTNQ